MDFFAFNLENFTPAKFSFYTGTTCACDKYEGSAWDEDVQKNMHVQKPSQSIFEFETFHILWMQQFVWKCNKLWIRNMVSKNVWPNICQCSDKPNQNVTCKRNHIDKTGNIFVIELAYICDDMKVFWRNVLWNIYVIWHEMFCEM